MSRPNKKPIANKPLNTPNAPQVSAKTAVVAEMPIGFWHNTRLHAWLIFAISFLLYANTLTHDFCQDDAIVITENMFTTDGMSGFGGILGNDTFYGFFKEEGKGALVAGGRYRPFTLLMFAFEYQLFGKNPFVGHLINVLLFAFMGVLIYFLMLKLLKNRLNTEGVNELKIKNSKLNAGQLNAGQLNANSLSINNYPLSIINYPIIAFVTALLFVVHPIHTEAVANIKGRDEIMTLLGSLAAVWFAIKYFETKNSKHILFAFICFLIGLLSKENAVTFVVIIPLIFYFFYNTNLIQSIKQALPFMVATVLFLILRGSVIGQQFGTAQTELMNNPFLKFVDNQYIPFDVSEKMATIVVTLGKYVQLLFMPFPLTHDYYPRHIGVMNFGNWEVLLSIGLYIGLIVLMVKNWAKRSLISFGIAYFLITLSIVSNIIFPVGTNMAERFLFMPSLGFCLIIAVLTNKLINILRGRNELKIKNLKLNNNDSVLKIKNLKLNNNDSALKTSNSKLNDNDSALKTNNLKLNDNDSALGINDLTLNDNDSALGINNSELNKTHSVFNSINAKLWTINHLSDIPKAVLIGLSLILIAFSIKTMDRNRAWEDNYTIFTTDINVSKNSAKLQNSVGGETIEHFKNETNGALKNAKMKEAITHLLRATEIHPTYKNPYLLMGNAYFYLNEFDKSIQSYEAGLKLDPNYKDAKQNLQLVYREGGKVIAQQQNNMPKGIEFMQKALELNPKDVETLSLLGTAYGISQQPQRSIEVLERALAIRFDRNDAQNLSVAYRQTGNVQKAMEWEAKLK